MKRVGFHEGRRVYFVKPINADGPIKIGLASDPSARLEVMQPHSPLKLEIMGSVPGNWADEQFLHDCLIAHHAHGEWFHPAAEVRDVVEQVLSLGSIDADSLTPRGKLLALKNRETRRLSGRMAAQA